MPLGWHSATFGKREFRRRRTSSDLHRTKSHLEVAERPRRTRHAIITFVLLEERVVRADCAGNRIFALFLHRVWPECAPGHKNGRRARMEQKRARALVFNQWVKSFGAP